MSAQFRTRRPMEAADTLMFRSEADPRSRSTVTGVFMLDRPPEWNRLVETWERASRIILPLRQRVVEPTVPVGLPMWVVDPDFDLAYHLRRARLPEPGTMQQLLDFLVPVIQAPLDRARPLWECTLVEGFEDGSAAWVFKANHAVTDGVGGLELAGEMFDLERDAPPRDMPPEPQGDLLSPNDLVWLSVSGAPGRVADAAGRALHTATRWTAHALRRPTATAADTAGYFASLTRVMRGSSVSPSPVWRGRSLRRRLQVVEVGLDELRAASRSAGGSVNDGLLAAVAGGVRRYHEKVGSPIDAIPIAMPINLRTEDDPAGGNRWTGAQLALPVGEPDVAERIRLINAAARRVRREPALDVMSVMAPVAARLPMWMLAAAFGDAARPDLQVSNIPGSPVPLYMAGAKVTKMIGFGPIPGPAAMITMNSYAGRCFIGVNLDPAAITDPDLWRECLEEGIAELVALDPPRERDGGGENR